LNKARVVQCATAVHARLARDGGASKWLILNALFKNRAKRFHRENPFPSSVKCKAAHAQ
jgi:hypothetical protein